MKTDTLIHFEKNTLSRNELVRIYEEVSWGNSNDYQELLSIQSNEFCVYYSMYVAKELVGFSKILTDTYSFTLLLELVIRPQFQNIGYGKQLLAFIENTCTTSYLFVHSLRTTEGFFQSEKFKIASSYSLLLKKVR